MVKEEVYQYQLALENRDGSAYASARELFGVSRSGAIRLTLAGGAFIFDSSELTAEAKRLLKGAAATMRRHPQEKVIVEGHTDSIGTEEYNMALSRRRCQAAVQYLLREEGIPASRIVSRWYGEARPVAENATSEGRRLNRRVELKGAFEEKSGAAPQDRYRTAPFVVINDREVPVDRLGRFSVTIPASAAALKVRMGDSRGRTLSTVLPVPSLRMTLPEGGARVRYGASASGYRVSADGSAVATITGSSEPGGSVVLDGQPLHLEGSGAFRTELPLKEGENVFGVVLKNAAGCSRLLNLRVRCTPHQPAGEGRLQP